MQEDNFQKILVHAPNWVGDHVMAFPFYRALQKLFPKSEKILLARAWVKDLLPEDIFSQLIIIEKKNFPVKDFSELRKSPANISFSLSPSFRSLWYLTLSKAKLRFAYPNLEGRILLRTSNYKKQIPPYTFHQHRALSYIRLLSPFLPSNMLAEDLFFELTQKEPLAIVNKEKQILKDKFKKNYWLVAPGSSAESKIYPLEYHAQVILSLLHKKIVEQIILIGSLKEKEQCQTIIQIVKKNSGNKNIVDQVLDFSGKTSLSQLLLLMNGSQGVTANDSGIAHMAYLSNSRLVTFIGMARRQETLSLAKKKIVLMKNLPCLGCMKHKCPQENINQCLKDIHPQQVVKAVTSILSI